MDKLKTCAPLGTNAASWTQSQADIHVLAFCPYNPPLWVPFAAQECSPMETALVSLTFSGNMTLVDQLGSRSAELAQPQQVPLPGTPCPHSAPNTAH